MVFGIEELDPLAHCRVCLGASARAAARRAQRSFNIRRASPLQNARGSIVVVFCVVLMRIVQCPPRSADTLAQNNIDFDASVSRKFLKVAKALDLVSS